MRGLGSQRAEEKCNISREEREGERDGGERGGRETGREECEANGSL